MQRYLASGVGFLALVLLIASCAGTGWNKATILNLVTNNGLFRSCLSGSSICRTNLTDDSLRAIQAFAIIAVLANAWALVIGGFLLYKTQSKPLQLMSTAAYGFAALSALISGSIYAAEIEKGKTKLILHGIVADVSYDWGFMLCWISMILQLIAASLTLMLPTKS